MNFLGLIHCVNPDQHQQVIPCLKNRRLHGRKLDHLSQDLHCTPRDNREGQHIPEIAEVATSYQTLKFAQTLLTIKPNTELRLDLREVREFAALHGIGDAPQ